jgi:hypothetical protein
MVKNPRMDKRTAFAIATQQAYAAGKAPKSYGTKAGRREAKRKYDEPKSHYKKTAAMAACADEIAKIAQLGMPALPQMPQLTQALPKIGNTARSVVGGMKPATLGIPDLAKATSIGPKAGGSFSGGGATGRW